MQSILAVTYSMLQLHVQGKIGRLEVDNLKFGKKLLKVFEHLHMEVSDSDEDDDKPDNSKDH